MKKLNIVFGALFLCFITVNSYSALLPASGDLTGGALGNDSYTDTFIDWIIPVIGSENTFIFINPRASMTGSALFSDDASELNAGAGIRHYAESLNAVLGINAYYDARATENENKFQQAGGGIEFLGKWFDVRANGYIPVGNDEAKLGRVKYTPSGHYMVSENLYEVSMYGFDCEAGLRIPLPHFLGQLKIFGGYYFFDADKANEAVQGAKGRVEYKPLNILRLNFAMFENDNLNGANWQAGADISIPVNINIGNIFRNGNIFENFTDYIKPKPKDVKERMGEMVQRDMYVRTAKVKRVDSFDILRGLNGDDIYFVVVDKNAASGGAGTFADPAPLEEAVSGNVATVEDNLTFLILEGAYAGLGNLDFSSYLSTNISLMSPSGANFLGVDISAAAPGATGRASFEFASNAGIVFESASASNQTLTVAGIDLKGISGTSSAGISINNIAGFHFAEGTLENFNNGINIANSQNVLIESAVIRNNFATGLKIEDSSGISLDNVTISGNGAGGLVISGSSDISFGNMEFTGNTGGGLSITD